MQKNLRKYFPVFVLPTLTAFLIAFVIPFIMGIYLSFCEFTTVTNAHFVGLSNYARVWENREFLQSLIFTVLFSVVAIISVNIFAFLLALLLTKGLKGTNFFRTVFFMPNLIGGIVLGYIWQSMINGVLEHYGVTMLMDAKYGFWGLVILMNWQMIGYIMVIYIAGLQNVSPDLIEAAKMDGASPIKTLFRIKVPLIMSSITICLFLMITNSFKMFDQNLALTAGGPSNKTAMMALDIYQTFYGKAGYEGIGQAKAVVFFLIVAVIGITQVALSRRKEIES